MQPAERIRASEDEYLERERRAETRTYLEATVACGRLCFHPKDANTFSNPRVLVEVISLSTGGPRWGSKFPHYRTTIESLAEYVIVHGDERRVEHYRKIETGQWLITDLVGDEAVLALPALGIELPLAELYAKLELLEGDTAGEA